VKNRAPLRASPLSSFAIACLVALAGCAREQRDLHAPSSQANTFLPQSTSAASNAARVVVKRDEDNSYAISQGKQLYNAYNCGGCHAQGGGGSGPALMDDVWIYGAEPDDVFASIVWGRPNGMPSFGSRIAEYQVWQITAYVRSMTGLVSTIAAPGRNDAIQAKPSEQLADKQPPRPAAAAINNEQPK